MNAMDRKSDSEVPEKERERKNASCEHLHKLCAIASKAVEGAFGGHN